MAILLSHRENPLKTDQHLPKFITPEEIDRINMQVDDPKLIAAYCIYEVTDGQYQSDTFTQVNL